MVECFRCGISSPQSSWEAKGGMCPFCGKWANASPKGIPVISWRTRWKWEFRFDRHDMWVGIYWTVKEVPPPRRRHFYVCVLPFFVVHVYQEGFIQ